VAGERGPGGEPPRAGRAVAAGLAACLLVALAAAGSLRGPLGSGGGRPRFPLELVETLGLLIGVAAVALLVLGVAVLAPDQRLRAPTRRSGVSGVLLVVLIVLGFWLFREPLSWFGGGNDPAITVGPPPSGVSEPPLLSTRYAWVPVVLVALLVVALAGALAAQAVAERRRRAAARSPRERLLELVDDTLDDVTHEPDPRRAVIAAWARMERGLAAVGLPRRAAEAPFEYVARVLGEARISPPASHRLTDLFERAKFSRHAVDRAMRDDAVQALLAVRRELQAQAGAGLAAAAAEEAEPEGSAEPWGAPR
jgi:Domain of unknown function (DUF4129)